MPAWHAEQPMLAISRRIFGTMRLISPDTMPIGLSNCGASPPGQLSMPAGVIQPYCRNIRGIKSGVGATLLWSAYSMTIAVTTTFHGKALVFNVSVFSPPRSSKTKRDAPRVCLSGFAFSIATMRSERVAAYPSSLHPDSTGNNTSSSVISRDRIQSRLLMFPSLPFAAIFRLMMLTKFNSCG